MWRPAWVPTVAWKVRLQRLAVRVERLPTGQALAWLLLATMVSSLPLIAALEVNADPEREDKTDLPIFRDRTDTILRGEWLYKDTELVTLTPPLINYIMVVPNILGDTIALWEAYFSAWSWAVGAILYLSLRRYNAGLAFAAGLIYVSSPFAYYTSVAMVQDDTIVPAFVAGTLAALLAERHVRGALWSGAGTLVKAWPGIAAPIVFLAAPGARLKALVAAAGMGIALLICLPFLIAAPDGFNAFLRFYLLGESPDGAFEGLSLWRFLWLRGWDFTQKINLAALLGAYLWLWWGVWRKRIAPVPAAAAAYFLLFVLYPKLHFGYYLLGMVAALPWAVLRWQRVAALFGAALVARGAHMYWVGGLSTEGNGIFVAITAAAALIVFWAGWLRLALREGDFRARWQDAAAWPVFGLGLAQVAIAVLTGVVTAVVRA